MKFRFDRSFVIKATLIMALLMTLPSITPMAIEFVVLVDLMGLEALILFLLYQGRQSLTALAGKAAQWRAHLGCTLLLLAGLYFLEPHIALAHLGGSAILLMFASSAVLALLLWIPPLLLSRTPVQALAYGPRAL